VTKPDDVRPNAINAALANWRQGDCVLDGEHWFAYRGDDSSQMSVAEAGDPAQSKSTVLESQVVGLVVLTQTCDVVRSCRDRPFVEVAPLVQVKSEDLPSIERGRRPRYAFIAGVSDKNLVGDLDRVMTVEKSVVMRWNRIAGCRTDNEVRTLADALARKRGRFAFPDDFTRFVRKLQDRLQGKHDRLSSEGEALRGLREIRVRAAPSWNAAMVELTFWFICEDDSASQRKNGETFVSAWLKHVPAMGRFKSVEGVLVTLDELTARDYVESDHLDLDHLSG